MRDKLRALPGIESGEKSMVSILLTQSVFLGIFIGAFDITAHSLLLSTFDEKMMARGYVVSGTAGIFLTVLYSRLQRSIHFSNFAVINLVAVGLLTLSLWSVLIFSPAKWIIFLVFIMLGPLNIMALSVFWGTADRLIAGRKEKSLFRFSGTGLIIGILIISFIVPVLMSFKLQSHNLLLISISSVIVATIIQRRIAIKFNLVEVDSEEYPENPDKKKPVFIVFREDPFIRTLGIFAALSVLTAFFIQYSFMAVTREQYPVAEDMAGFLGLLTGGMMIFILFFKLVVFPYVLHNYGLRNCLIIPPLLIAVFTAITILIGFLTGYTPEATSGFIIFFVLLAFSRIISKSMKDSIEIPSLKVIYQSFEKKIGSELRSAMDGTINEIALFISGVVLTGFGLFGFIKLIHFSIFLFIITIIWLFTAIRLFKEYRNSIISATEKAIQEGSGGDKSNEQNLLSNRFSAHIDFKTDYFSLISGNFSVLNTVTNKLYFEEIIDYAYSKKDINLLPVLKKTANITSIDEEVRQHSADVAEILQKNSTILKSDNEKIDAAIKILAGSRMPQTTEVLRLLRDKSPESKRLAIFMIGKFRLNDLLSEVCECLNVPGLANDASEVLKSFGPDIEDALVRFYLIASGNIRLSKTILRLLGKTRSKETLGFLFSRLWTNSRQLKEIAVKCLIDCKFRPSEEESQRLHQLTSEVIGIITWNISAKVSLERDNDDFLHDKLNQEINRWNKFLFDLLSIKYNSWAIDRIRENFGKATIESVTNAIEMTDIVVSDSIKSKLIYLLDIGHDEDRLKNLFQFYPGEIPGRKKLLEDIINRDYNLISLWTKACTLRSITSIEGDEMAESVTALLFSPEELIQEEAANLITRSKPELYISASERIPDTIKMRLDNIINGTTDKREFLFEKLIFLTKFLRGITEDDLLPVAYEMQYCKNFDRKFLKSSGGHIIWTLDGDSEGNEVHVAYNGEIDVLAKKYESGHNLSFYFLPLDAVEEYHFQYPDNSYEILKYIEANEK